MSSRLAMKNTAARGQYRAARQGSAGAVSRAVRTQRQEIMGGCGQPATYVGAHRLKELSKRTTFVRVTQQPTRYSAARLSGGDRLPRAQARARFQCSRRRNRDCFIPDWTGARNLGHRN